MANDDTTKATENLTKTNEKLLAQRERLAKAEDKRLERNEDATEDLTKSILQLLEGNERLVDLEEKKLKTLRRTKQTLESYENLGKQLKTSLFGPLEGLLKRIPEPLRLLGKMAIRPMVRGLAKKQERQFRTEQRKGITQSGAFQEARGREISQKGFYKGTVAAYAGFIPGLGKWKRGKGYLGYQGGGSDDSAGRERETKAGFISRKVMKHLKKIEENTGNQLKETKEQKKGGFFSLLMKLLMGFLLLRLWPFIRAALGIGTAVAAAVAAAAATKDKWEGWWEGFKKESDAVMQKYKDMWDSFEAPPMFGKEFTTEYWEKLWKDVHPHWLTPGYWKTLGESAGMSPEDQAIHRQKARDRAVRIGITEADHPAPADLTMAPFNQRPNLASRHGATAAERERYEWGPTTGTEMFGQLPPYIKNPSNATNDWGILVPAPSRADNDWGILVPAPSRADNLWNYPGARGNIPAGMPYPAMAHPTPAQAAKRERSKWAGQSFDEFGQTWPARTSGLHLGGEKGWASVPAFLKNPSNARNDWLYAAWLEVARKDFDRENKGKGSPTDSKKRPPLQIAREALTAARVAVAQALAIVGRIAPPGADYMGAKFKGAYPTPAQIEQRILEENRRQIRAVRAPVWRGRGAGAPGDYGDIIVLPPRGKPLVDLKKLVTQNKFVVPSPVPAVPSDGMTDAQRKEFLDPKNFIKDHLALKELMDRADRAIAESKAGRLERGNQIIQNNAPTTTSNSGNVTVNMKAEPTAAHWATRY